MDLQLSQRLWIVDRVREWAERCGFAQGSVWSIPVVVGLEFAQRVEKVALVPDQGAARSSRRQLCIQRSMKELIRGIWMPVVTTPKPASVTRASKAAVNF
ncbi:hypothetical protein Z951_34675 [Streptomyces sp. PRh5]|nr:hypothetical protein Z951_34675 [Streptomyces sp. PRh5]